MVGPERRDRTGPPQNPGADLGDEADLLGDRDEHGRRDEPALAVRHAQQRLEPEKLFRRNAEERLEVKVEGFRRERVPDLLLQFPAALQLGLDRALEEDEVIALPQPRAIERQARALQEALRIVAVARHEGDADAGGEGDLVTLEGERLADRLEHRSGEILRFADSR